MKFAAIDFETANKSSNSACALGIVVVEDNIVTQQEYFLIRPPSSQFEFTHIHGLKWKDVTAAPTFGQLWPKINKVLVSTEFLAAHYATFDRNVLQECCNLYQISPPTQPFLCTVQLARRVWGIRPTKLPDVCAYLDIELQHHQALSDAHACAQIVIKANVN
jgi:DNA polymerase III subunit epsilon